MASLREKVPAETRFDLATQGLTGAYTAISKALRDALGEDRYNEFSGALWYAAGKKAKDFASSIGFAPKNPEEIAALMDAFAFSVMGRELQTHVSETTDGRCVQRATQCPWHERWKEQGLDFDFCHEAHQRWGEGVCESLNADFSFRHMTSLVRGDPYCELVIERTK